MRQTTSNIVSRPDVRCEKSHAILAVSDVRSAIDFYTNRLGFWLAFAEGDPPTFAGLNLGSVQLFLERGTPSPQGCSVYFVIDDADALHRFHESSGIEILEPPGDRPYGLRDYTVRDSSGYRLAFGHHPEHCAAHNERP
jgi:predicted enzyme related to lactoylglutathione lyase